MSNDLTVILRDSEFDYLKETVAALPETAKITEWGSGGSTVYWAKTLKAGQTLHSIEHDPEWYNLVTSKIQDASVQCSLDYMLFPSVFVSTHPITITGHPVIGTAWEESPVSLKDYLYPKPDIFDSDLFIIDGLARSTCALMIKLYHTKPDPIILWHDFRGREHFYDCIYPHFSRIETVNSDPETTLTRLYL